MWPKPFFVETNVCINLTMETSGPKNVCSFFYFQKPAKSKQSPKGRKFAKSGHPEIEGNANNVKVFQRMHIFVLLIFMRQNLEPILQS
jgi:hypothetical protein